jgi:hypothetical protein
LLSISYQWWQDGTAFRVRYEDLLRDPKSKFVAIAKALDAPTNRLEAILQEINFETFQAMPNHHGWQGKSRKRENGAFDRTPRRLWRKLIPTIAALNIYAYHLRVFKALGYAPPVSLLRGDDARRNWERLKTPK